MPDAAEYAQLHRALIAGLPTQIGFRGDRGLYDGPRSRKFQLFPGSPLSKKPPPWVLSATLLDTERVWSLTNAAIEPDWAITELPHLLARRQHDPRWSRSQGRVVGSEQISLFGLVLAPKRPVHYGALFPEEGRAIFARDALVTGEINTRCAFLPRNLATLAKARDEEAKQRRSGLVVDEEWMAQWYLDRLPAHVHNAQALDAWYGKLSAGEKASLEWSLSDLMVGDESDAVRFPPYLALGNARLAVKYRFEPGAPDDGMTLAVPLHLLNALDPARLSWLAPGFVADKAAALIKSLPKILRRNFVPAPDFARAFHEAHPQPSADSLVGELARFLQKLTGVAVSATDFDEASLEPHLRMNLQLLDRRQGRAGMCWPNPATWTNCASVSASARPRHSRRARPKVWRSRDCMRSRIRRFRCPCRVPAACRPIRRCTTMETACRCACMPSATWRGANIRVASGDCWRWRWPTSSSRRASSCRSRRRPACCTPRSNRPHRARRRWPALEGRRPPACRSARRRFRVIDQRGAGRNPRPGRLRRRAAMRWSSNCFRKRWSGCARRRASSLPWPRRAPSWNRR